MYSKILERIPFNELHPDHEIKIKDVKSVAGLIAVIYTVDGLNYGMIWNDRKEYVYEYGGTENDKAEELFYDKIVYGEFN